MSVYLLNRTQPHNPALSSESFYATRIDPPKGYVCMYVCMYVFMYLYFLNCTQPGNPALSSESFYATRIDTPKGASMIYVTKISDQTRQRCMYVCSVYVCM